MNYKLKKLATNWRVILLAVFIIVSLIAIHPTLSEGVAIRSVVTNSSASIAGIPQPKPNIQPVSRERILSINNRPIDNVESYYNFVSALSPNRTIQIKTTKSVYKLTTREKFETVQLNEAEEKIITETAVCFKGKYIFSHSCAVVKKLLDTFCAVLAMFFDCRCNVPVNFCGESEIDSS